MDDVIEAGLDTLDGIADCRFEPQRTDDNVLYYNVTILYPNIINGFSRSEIYCHDMYADTTGNYHFDPMDENIHPKIKRMEEALGEAIRSAQSV